MCERTLTSRLVHIHAWLFLFIHFDCTEAEEMSCCTVQTIVGSKKHKFTQTSKIVKSQSEAQVTPTDIYDQMTLFDKEIGKLLP